MIGATGHNVPTGVQLEARLKQLICQRVLMLSIWSQN